MIRKDTEMRQEQGGRAVPVRRVVVCGPDGGEIDDGTQTPTGAEDAFEETCHQRSIVESEFLSFKCRFTALIRAKTLPTQRLQLLLRCVCYNLLP